VSRARSDDRAYSVFDEIRSACLAVAESAHHVRVCPERIPAYARGLLLDPLRRLAYDEDHHFTGGEAETIAYVVTLDAVNFGSGYFPHLRKRPGMSGYYTIASGLADRFRGVGPLRPDELASITASECGSLFGQEAAAGPISELMELFARAWNDLGRDLADRFGGRFTGLVDAAERSAERLVTLLSAQPFFRDVSAHRHVEVPFYKRAQIMASDLALAFGQAGFGRFDDLDRLTIFADNLVPHVLRLDGILRYEEPLRARIARGDLIPSGSEEEVEIRACAVHAVDRIARHLRGLGRPVTERQLDVLLWTRGQSPAYKRHPRHRTRSVFY
jgi:hypothetical protein